ncbi:MAG: hypothetical protein B7733_08865 [Myxococcales bacterium FL481]|nr:MAG: hypothetical protein B7733_08865 [Myxococcales bacterium FL481]
MRSRARVSRSGPTYLDDAIATVVLRERDAGEVRLDPQLLDARDPVDLLACLRAGPAPRVIPQIKRRARDPDMADFSAAHLAATLADAGAPLISVCTSERDGGPIDDLPAACGAVAVPVLWSDLVVSSRQLVVARRAGAQAVVLTVLALPPPRLRELAVLARRLGLAPVGRVHDEAGIERALAAGIACLEVSAREPATGSLDLERACSFRSSVPRRFGFIVGGGISDHGQVVAMRGRDIDAVVVGRHLMQADDPGLALMSLAAY